MAKRHNGNGKARVDAELKALLELFETGEVVEVGAHSAIGGEGLPSAKWSFCNRLLMVRRGTADARGYRQWEGVGRNVAKGSKAIYILGPRLINVVEEDEETGEETKRQKLIGFRAIPVFRVEDTDGEALPTYEPPAPPPLLDVAKAWDLEIKYEPFHGGAWGSYNLSNGDIRLATHDQEVFFHELSHAAHQRVNGSLKRGQDWRQEIVAELSAAVLARLYGLEVEARNYRYIKSYATKANLAPAKACVKVLADVGEVLALILDQHDNNGDS